MEKEFKEGDFILVSQNDVIPKSNWPVREFVYKNKDGGFICKDDKIQFKAWKYAERRPQITEFERPKSVKELEIELIIKLADFIALVMRHQETKDIDLKNNLQEIIELENQRIQILKRELCLQTKQ